MTYLFWNANDSVFHLKHNIFLTKFLCLKNCSNFKNENQDVNCKFRLMKSKYCKYKIF